MLSHAIAMAKSDDDLLLRLTSRSCGTRFSASQYVEFRKLIDSLPLYIKTFREFKYTEVSFNNSTCTSSVQTGFTMETDISFNILFCVF